jgi:integrase/recombinase XerC
MKKNVGEQIQPPSDTSDVSAATVFAPESGRWFQRLKHDGKADNTLASYTRDLRKTAETLGKLLGHAVRTRHLASVDQLGTNALVEVWTTEGASVQTVLRRFAAIRGFARHLELHEDIECGHLLCATLPRMARFPKGPIDAEAITAITAEETPDANWIDLRGRAIFALQASTAMTTAEIVALNRGQVFGRLGAITVVDTHLVPRLVAACPEAESLMRRYLAAAPFELGPGDPLFINRRGHRLTARSIQVAFKRRAHELALPTRASPMALRHAVGRSMAQSGHLPSEVAAALGISFAAVARYFDAS